MVQGTRSRMGIDVAKAQLDVAVRPSLPGWPRSYPNTALGIQALVSEVAAVDPISIVVEASGSYERPLTEALNTAGIPVSVVNPRQVRDFAKATGQLAKTDRLDAAVLAWFGEAIDPPASEASSPAVAAIRALRVRRQQLSKMIVAERARLDTVSPETRDDILATIDWLEERKKAIETRLDDALSRDPASHQRAQLLRSFCGIGPVSAGLLVATFPELGRLDQKKVGALIGCAPVASESGQMIGKRSIRGGRHEIRRALYMPTLTAITFNPQIRSFYLRLIAAKKPPKVAIVACMRKMLIICNAMLRDGVVWKGSQVKTTTSRRAVSGGPKQTRTQVAPPTTIFTLDDSLAGGKLRFFT
jgi:transposase